MQQRLEDVLQRLVDDESCPADLRSYAGDLQRKYVCA